MSAACSSDRYHSSLPSWLVFTQSSGSLGLPGEDTLLPQDQQKGLDCARWLPILHFPPFTPQKLPCVAVQFPPLLLCNNEQYLLDCCYVYYRVSSCQQFESCHMRWEAYSHRELQAGEKALKPQASYRCHSVPREQHQRLTFPLSVDSGSLEDHFLLPSHGDPHFL